MFPCNTVVPRTIILIHTEFVRTIFSPVGMQRHRHADTNTVIETGTFRCRFKESFLWAAAKGGRVEECESLVQMGTGELLIVMMMS